MLIWYIFNRSFTRLCHIPLQMKIVNDEGCVVPVNTQGELHIRAYSMMLYYLEDEEKTKEFRDSNGWAHTGYVYVYMYTKVI